MLNPDHDLAHSHGRIKNFPEKFRAKLIQVKKYLMLFLFYDLNRPLIKVITQLRSEGCN